MGIKTLLVGGILAVSATASLAQSLDPVRIEMFRSILAGNESTLTEAAAANILPRLDFSREETRGIVGALVAAGEVRLDGSTLNLVDGSCATAAHNWAQGETAAEEWLACWPTVLAMLCWTCRQGRLLTELVLLCF